MAKQIWWGTWPGALAMGFAAFVLGSAGLLTGAIGLLIPPPDNTGVDVEMTAQPAWLGVLWAVQVLAGLALPILTTYWSRKTWAGYVLLGLGLAAVLGIFGLFQSGIL